MRLKRLDPPAKRSQKLVSLYDQLITSDMVRMARAHPGETFAKAPRPICFVSREAPGRPGKFTLYMSWDPHYWARVDAQKKEK